MAKVINCILIERSAKEIVKELQEQKGIVRANRSSARGGSLITGDSIEVDILSVVVEDEYADEIFEYLYFRCEIFKEHHGLMYQSSLDRASEYRLPSESEVEVMNRVRA